MSVPISRQPADEVGDGAAAARPLAMPRWRLRGVLLAVAVGAVVGAFANEWISGRLPGGWRFEFLTGALLLAAAVGFASILLARAWRELHAANQLLSTATGNLSQAYDALLATNRALSETAEARDRALTHLQAAIREREAFLASVSHDLKSPLTIIKGHADLLNRHVKSTGTPNVERLSDGLDRIVSGAASISAMVDELLWLARLEMDQQVDLQLAETDLVDLARSSVDDFAGTTSRHRLRFTTDVDTVIGWWDEARLERVVANLLTNAIKFSPEGGDIDVSVSKKPSPPGAAGAIGDVNDLVAVLRVSDRGVGIPEADLPHVFERFYRGDNVGGVIAGTGVGLAGVRNTVEAHGGTISAERREGGGTTFTVRLPVVSPPLVPDADAASRHAESDPASP